MTSRVFVYVYSLVKSVDTTFREAEKFDSQGDEERAFIMYMRYFNIVKHIKANADYKKNKVFWREKKIK